MYNANYTHSSGSWTSSTRFGYNRSFLFRYDVGFGADLAGVSFSGFSSGGAEYYILNGRTTSYLQDVAINRGRHTIEFGGVVQRQTTNSLDLNTTNFSYSSLSDFQNNLPSTAEHSIDHVPEDPTAWRKCRSQTWRSPPFRSQMEICGPSRFCFRARTARPVSKRRSRRFGKPRCAKLV